MSKTDNQNLGDLGEEIAKEFLEKKYKNVTDLNKLCPNAPYADIYAEKGEEKLIISVKTRNKIGANKKENPSYNLSCGNNHDRVKLAKEKFNLIPYWIAITIDKPENKWVYSICFGSLKCLRGKKAIPIQECLKGKIGECWFKERSLPAKWVKKLNEMKY